MLTQHDLVALVHAHRDTLVLSLYLDGRVSDPAERDRWFRVLDGELRARRVALGDAPRAEREAFESAAGRLLERLPAHDHALGSVGWVGLASAGAVLYEEAVPMPMPFLVAWGRGVRVAPYVRMLRRLTPVVVAAADAREARVYRYERGELALVGVVPAVESGRPVEHLGDAPRPGFHTGTRGALGVDEAERRRVAALERMAVAVGPLVARAAGDAAWVVLGGTPEVVHHLRVALPGPLDARVHVAASLHGGARGADVLRAAEDGARALGEARDLARVSEVLERWGADGLGTVGAQGVRRALEERSVQELLVTRRFVETRPDEAEALVSAALLARADVGEVVGAASDLLDAGGDGVAARLRFAAAFGAGAPAGR